MKTVPVASLRERTAYSAVAHLVFYGLVIALPLLLALGALLFHAIRAEREQLEKRVVQVLNDLTDNLDRDFDRHLIILHTLAVSRSLRDEDWPRFYERAKASLEGRAYIILIDRSGRQLINTYLPFGQQPE